MRIGIIRPADPRHGLHRYARRLGEALAALPGTDVATLDLPDPADPDAAGALSAFAGVDVIHVQFNVRLFGGEEEAAARYERFAQGAPAPLVVSLHDVYLDDPWYRIRRRPLLGRFAAWRRARRRARVRRDAFAVVVARAARVLVCFEEERRRLGPLRVDAKVDVVPHFVESLGPLPDPDEARRALALEGRRIVTHLGYIHPRKGVDLALRALALLPDDVSLALVGEARGRDEKKLRRWLARAERSGLRARVIHTGWVDEEEQRRWIAATDVALCPFRFLSASGSLSTWIASGKPIVATPAPQIEEYRRLAPGAFRTAADATPEGIARAVQEALEASSPSGGDPALRRLAEHLSLERTARRHLEVYERALAAPSNRASS